MMEHKKHRKKVKKLQEALQATSSPLSLAYGASPSNTTRSKSYKTTHPSLDFAPLNEVLGIVGDVVYAEPRVTMDKLVRATLPYGKMPAVVPEFKGITVGGALMGAAAESSSHRYGIFHDTCQGLELLAGDGRLLQASPSTNRNLFYGVSGSYGSLGALTAAALTLVPAHASVRLRYRLFQDPQELFARLATPQEAEFVDALVFSPHHAVLIEGFLEKKAATTRTNRWFYERAKQAHEESIPLYDYLFRYDRGAFWMGSYLFHLPFLRKFLQEGVLHLSQPKLFTEKERQKFQIRELSWGKRLVGYPFATSTFLWKLLHRAEEWVRKRFVIQDFCIPASQAALFFLENPGIYPLWICPIRGTKTPQIFAPHTSQEENLFINIGMYGLPPSKGAVDVTKELEKKTRLYEGRKVLYSHSYYTPKEFWEIYPESAYRQLRKESGAEDRWLDITEKVLSK